MPDKSDYLLSNYFETWPPQSAKEIETGFRKASLDHHPDQGGSTEEFVRIQQEKERLQRSVEEEETDHEISLSEYISMEETLKSNLSYEELQGNYSLENPVSNIWMDSERWTGIIREEESDLSIHLNIDLPFELEEPVSFEAAYFQGSETLTEGSGYTEQISDFMASNNLDERAAYQKLVGDISSHVLSKAEEILYSQ